MRPLIKWIFVAALLAASGCHGEGMSQARRDHILAGDHGWLDVTVKAPARADFDANRSCMVSLILNGEPALSEAANLAEADAGGLPVGYRFVAPAGRLQAQLALDGCVRRTYFAKLDLLLEKDHLANLLFDGKTLVVQSSTPYEPTSLEWVRAEILKLHAHDSASGETLSTLTSLAIAILVLNAVTLALVLLKWRRTR